MLSELLKQNKTFLEKRDSYMLTHLDKLICMLNKLEKNAGSGYFDAFKRKEVRKGGFLLQEGTVYKHIWILEKGLARVFNLKMASKLRRTSFPLPSLSMLTASPHSQSLLRLTFRL